jgi:UDP:flavonoid glycosyltransferase YjiC (YdhE family)
VPERRFLIAAFGDAGHAFPAISLARALAARGHKVVVETWEQWRQAVESEGLEFRGAEEYRVFASYDAETGPAAGDAALALLPLLDELRPDVVVNDILTLAPAIAAERAGVAWATLIPHLFPEHEEGLPFFAFGAQPPRTPLGRVAWTLPLPMLRGGLRQGRAELNVERERAGLRPTERLYGGTSQELAMVATYPQLEYPRRWPPHVHVTGPMEFEMPSPDIEIPAGDEPLVLVAPSTAQDPECRLVRSALAALADEPVRVVATTNGHYPEEGIEVPANAVLHGWLRYSQLMGEADLVICHGGHGTVARSLAAGTPLLCCPAVGDMSENAARVVWSGTGLMVPWRLTNERSLRLASRRVLREGGFAAKAGKIADWAGGHDGAVTGAQLVEGLAARHSRRESP